MFSPQPMKHVLLQVMTEDLPQVSLILAELQVFGPDYRPFHDSQYRSIPGQRFRELYHRAVSRLQKISGHVRIGSQVALNELHVVREDELEETDRWLGETWDRCSTFEENLRHQSEEQQLLDQLEQALGNFGELNIDLGLLQGERMFLDIRLGMIPRTHVGQLKEAIALANYLLFPYLEHDEMVHVIVVGPKGERERELGSVLDTAGFRPLTIPVELQGEPSRVRIELQKRRLALKQASNREREIARQFASEIRERLEECQRTLVMAEPFVRLDTAVRTGGYTSVISGWIPARDVRRTERALVAGLSNPLHIEVRNPLPEERPLVPSYMPDNRLMAPFATLVKQYGIPRYGEVDPTAIFAVTFILMFGMMFGDVGHGLTIALAAWLARRKLKSFTLFTICIGFSAALFGIFYGSLFGYEGLFHALWLPPLSDPLYMLSVALMWGIGFLLLISFVSIYNRFIQGDLTRAIFASNGVVSTLLYASLLYGIYNLYREGSFGVPAASVSILALAVVLAYKLTETQASAGERMLVAVVETFETITGYISNTLSFLRVAAFSLNHVALAIAVFTLADMMNSTQGQVLMVILGNLFILILEGAIVTIQALRLEYYEGFSRFYSGDGREFKPLRLNLGGTP